MDVEHIDLSLRESITDRAASSALLVFDETRARGLTDVMSACIARPILVEGRL